MVKRKLGIAVVRKKLGKKAYKTYNELFDDLEATFANFVHTTTESEEMNFFAKKFRLMAKEKLSIAKEYIRREMEFFNQVPYTDKLHLQHQFTEMKGRNDLMTNVMRRVRFVRNS